MIEKVRLSVSRQVPGRLGAVVLCCVSIRKNSVYQHFGEIFSFHNCFSRYFKLRTSWSGRVDGIVSRATISSFIAEWSKACVLFIDGQILRA